ncbi:endonuclease/exonuclease/phosphatase family protein [Sphaerisporangium sp. NPDC004334]
MTAVTGSPGGRDADTTAPGPAGVSAAPAPSGGAEGSGAPALSGVPWGAGAPAMSGVPRGSGAPGRTERARQPRARWCLGTRLVVAATLAWAALLVAHALLSGRWWLWLVVELAPPILLPVVPLALLVLTPFAARPVRLPIGTVQVASLLLGAALSGLTLPGGAPAGGGVPGAGISGAAGAAGTVKVFSWNTGYWHQGEDPSAFYAYLRAQHADVYLLQEYLNFGDDPIRIDDLRRVREAFPGYHVVAASELITISRLPVVASRPVDASALMSPADGSAPPPGAPWRDYYTTKALRTDLRVGGAVVSFYNVHLAVQVDIRRSPLSAGFYRVIHDQHGRRQAELRALRAEVAGNALPAVVAGDFNSTSSMRDLRRMCAVASCQNPRSPAPLPLSWPVQGLGPVPWPLWRLDWVMSRGGARVDGYRFVGPDGLSDHMGQTFSVGVA